jgi:cyanate permease
MGWLLLFAIPLGLLVLASHIHAGTIALRELRRLPAQVRAMPPRRRALVSGYVAFALALGAAAAWVAENPEHWHTAGWALLAPMALMVVHVLLVLPVFIWREYRDHKRRLRRDG